MDKKGFKDKYLRALADYHNLEKRLDEEKKRFAQYATKDLIIKLLPFLDNLEQAEAFIKDEGLQLVKNQFMKTLEGEGLQEVEVLGKEFDPEVAEAVEVVKGKEDNKIVEVLKKGYKFNDAVIRPAQVKVSKI